MNGGDARSACTWNTRQITSHRATNSNSAAIGCAISAATRDQARIGLLMLRRGIWEGRRLLPEAWIAELLAPCALNQSYGLLWWLNTGRRRYPSATAASFTATGAGGNITWVDPEHDLVAVMRWMDPASVDGFMRLVSADL